MLNLEEVFEKLEISSEKRHEVMKKEQVVKNMEKIFSGRSFSNRLLYTLACTASRNANVELLANLIESGTIKNESMLKECLKHMGKKEVSAEEMVSFVKSNEVDEESIKNNIAKMRREGLSKKDMLSKARNTMPCADFRIVMEEINKIPDDVEEHEENLEGGDWLEEGEIRKLPKPGETPQVSEEIRQAHLKRTGGRVVTRFPPEPNGILHIGHAKAINLSFEYAKKFGGYTYLRYDDTNPKNEEVEYFDSIYEDVRWLGFEPYKVTASSDYFDKMVEFGFQLIKKGKAYVCHLSQEEICERRRQYTSDNMNERSHLSQYRNRSVEENLRIFQEMVDGKWEEGTACLRFKMDTNTKNPLMLDLIGIRILNAVHPMKKVRYTVYPTYEFALCVSDSLEDVTHSFCTREFFTRQESYHWLLDQLEIYKPIQWEFSRLNISNTVLSKRKLVPLKKYGIELDDPRLFTIKGMRRRGFPPEAINEFCKSLGLTFAETIVDVKKLENFVRDNLNRTSRRIMCVRDPLKVTIMNAEPCSVSIPDFPGSEVSRNVPFTPVIYIEKSDFMDKGDGDFLRLTLDQPVGLYMLYPIRVVKVTEDGILAERWDGIPKKFIHWVSSDCVRVEMRMYSPLWTSFSPKDSTYLEEMNKDSLKIVHGLCDKRISEAGVEDRFQFQRIGYFCVDRDTTEENIVVNLTLPLKNIV
ncbi:glutaminyl-tRNA synthetase [Encephalitozoon intestinalis ATCC 50506]|uniref:glutamine--tRNA ligase n=1 Tax=Encephalitozoon intestinalis (strain ATCC 50506) TaxID=876142 RepID=E0S9T1_ENCIT|nr:glutaminyl-tRNA synthetase [Encephalitozoon intestinalis ATCC 50506]ADM12466.1 glutaminyl-tRNA synthetase [Encephalitozoon intestinalis ATCC 50506]UTX46302.1 glutamyl tRNA synthetase [Encephalitozoon intestinalis]